MIKLFILLSIVFQCINGISQEILVYTGTYQGKNIYVQNPFAANGVGYSVKNVLVNGEPILNDIVSSAFEIDLKLFNLNINSDVTIKIYHDTNCTPRIIDDLALTPPSHLNYLSIEVDTAGLLTWCTENEYSPKTFYIEQFKWNKWVVIGQVKGNGGLDKNCYEFLTDLHSSVNTFKVVQKTPGRNKNPGISPEAKVKSNVKISILNSTGNNLSFSLPTHFEIYNTFGEVVMKGYSAKPNLKSLPNGVYYLNYDNTTGDVFNKNKK